MDTILTGIRRAFWGPSRAASGRRAVRRNLRASKSRQELSSPRDPQTQHGRSITFGKPRVAYCERISRGADAKMSNSKANRWTAAELDRLQSLLDAGKTAREIAIELERTPSAIYGQVQRLYRKRDPAKARHEQGDPC